MRKSLIKKIKKAQEKRLTSGVLISDIGPVDKITALELLETQNKSSQFIIRELTRKLTGLRGEIEDAEIVIRYHEKTIDSREADIEKLHKEIDDTILNMGKASDARLEAAVMALTEGEAEFLNILLRAANSVNSKSNRDPLIAALQAVRDVAEERFSAIKSSLKEEDTGGK